MSARRTSGLTSAKRFDPLLPEFDVILIEGAGSPAETNLWPSDIVNMAVADLADSPVALIADIDRGGAFAHLFGTWALLPQPWQRRIEAFVLNNFEAIQLSWNPLPSSSSETPGCR